VSAASEASVYQQLRGHLAALRLTAAAEALPAQLERAAAEDTGHTAFLERLLAVEVAAAEGRRQASLARFACLPAPWRISDFDFDAQPRWTASWSASSPPCGSSKTRATCC